MDKPNTIESVTPHSGQYSFKTDLRLNAWLAVTTAVYLVTLWLNRHRDWPPLTHGAVALLPLAPALLYVRSWVHFIRGMDELQHRIQLEVHLFAALGTVIVAIVVDTLKANGVTVPLLPGGLSLGGAFFSMFILWLLGTGIAIRRYR